MFSCMKLHWIEFFPWYKFPFLCRKKSKTRPSFDFSNDLNIRRSSSIVEGLAPNKRLGLELKDQKIAFTHTSTNLNLTHSIYWYPTGYEKQLLRETWSDDFEFQFNLGFKLYEYIFEHNPHMKTLFPSIHKYGHKWRDSNAFRGQALKFVQTISMCIDFLNDTDRIAEILRAIGERHVQYANRGFKPIYWDIFLDAIEVSLEEHIASLENYDDEKRNDATKAWRKLAHYIITHMKRGYVRKLVQEFSSQEGSFAEWAEKHPSFKK